MITNQKNARTSSCLQEQACLFPAALAKPIGKKEPKFNKEIKEQKIPIISFARLA